MNHIDRERSLEGLEGHRWPDPPPDATGLVKAVHELRKRPIGSLTADELRRLIGQDVGLPWLLPLALEILRNTAPDQSRGGFYDDDLLSAVLTRRSAAWHATPELARELKDILRILKDLSPYIESEAEEFLSSLPEDL
ncbi:contact-dependent growth inhibition system immunity protein [Streptomyces sp. NBC_01481]|uniref:contact-dependent growth inhibition system immunity protein n=1 Tax=Streptomyces sp. NBC_01481 TaxID=2975869 RepID=UPI002255E64D|nr:contact-dependent growth inhibition system immunity protein [Streptomyces sp. NBC_01481]MCX4588092.1 contact-dependent growth inhibition system immunity protein [Streptomyces sp. NBC_01481]